jgi:hypothetical protein
MYVTTLHDFLKPLPGELKIPANFPEATVKITQFSEDVKKDAEGKDRTAVKLNARFGFKPTISEL